MELWQIIALVVTVLSTEAVGIFWISNLLPKADYYKSHKEIEARVRELEMWASTKSFYDGQTQGRKE